MNKKLIVIALMAASSFCAHANPFNDYLFASKEDVYQTELPDFSDMNVVGSWFEEAQFRVSSGSPVDDIGIQDDYLSYEVRVRPKAWGQKQLEEEILILRQQQGENNSQKQFEFSLQNRYLRVLDYLGKYHSNRHLEALADVLKRERRLLKSQVRHRQFNPKKLLDTESKLGQVKDRLALNKKQLKVIQAQFGMASGDKETNDFLKSQVQLSEIRSTLSVSGDIDQVSADVLGAQLQLQLSQTEQQLSKKKQQFGINLLKFEYSDKKDDEIAFQVGVNIPLGESFDDKENIYDIYEAKAALNENISKRKYVLSEIKQEIIWLAGKFELEEKQVERTKKYLQKKYIKKNPLLVISLQKKGVNFQQKKVSAHQKAIILYVKYLALSGALAEPPLRNWIQQGKPILSLVD